MIFRLPTFLRRKLITIPLFLGFAIFVLFVVLDLLFPFRVQIAYSQLITAKDSTVLSAFLSHDDKWRMKTELTEIMPQLREAIIFKEDRFFYYHPGINPVAVVKALGNNILKNRKTSGASTITMQVTRLLQPKKRTYSHKIMEMFRALQLEWHFSKDEILQMYLNLVPYGGNVEGVKSASVLYFNRLPDQLSLAQIVTLAIVPNRPTSLYLGRNNDFIRRERDRWIRKLPIGKIFPEKDIQDALSEPLEVKRQEAPKIAGHFARRMQRKFPSQDILHTTLDKEIQDKVQNLALNYSKRLKSLYINNVAVLVVNNRTQEVEAYIGSQDFSDNQNAGQVDGVKAVRSPGSTLKPLIYALGFDEGKLTPKTVLLDVPTAFGNFLPDNFDEKFNGKVSVEKSLSMSLNIPAVKALDEIGLPLMIQRLKQANFRQVQKDENKLGLSLALGGCGVTLEEMVGLYSSFANEGKFSQLIYSKNMEEENNIDFKHKSQDKDAVKKNQTSIQLFSPSAAYVITQILTIASRPDLPNGYQNSYHVPKIAWKTGTSYGRRDAWSIGYNEKYTIGVWVGNFTGTGVHELSGAEIATPLLFSIFNTLDYNSTNNWFNTPKDLKVRLVCSETGKVPNDFCKNKVVDYYLPLISPNEKCDHLKEVAVSPDEKISYCTACQPMKNYIKRLYANLSPELIDFYETQKVAFEKIPVHNPECNRVFDKQAPKIISPSDEKVYIVEKNSPPQLQLYCQADNEVKTVYWYINDKYYKSAKVSEKVFFSPSFGEVKISCSDDKGRNTDIRISVVSE